MDVWIKCHGNPSNSNKTKKFVPMHLADVELFFHWMGKTFDLRLKSEDHRSQYGSSSEYHASQHKTSQQSI